MLKLGSSNLALTMSIDHKGLNTMPVPEKYKTMAFCVDPEKGFKTSMISTGAEVAIGEIHPWLNNDPVRMKKIIQLIEIWFAPSRINQKSNESFKDACLRTGYEAIQNFKF